MIRATLNSNEGGALLVITGDRGSGDGTAGKCGPDAGGAVCDCTVKATHGT